MTAFTQGFMCACAVVSTAALVFIAHGVMVIATPVGF